jgi:hypothetical protein
VQAEERWLFVCGEGVLRCDVNAGVFSQSTDPIAPLSDAPYADAPCTKRRPSSLRPTRPAVPAGRAASECDGARVAK